MVSRSSNSKILAVFGSLLIVIAVIFAGVTLRNNYLTSQNQAQEQVENDQLFKLDVKLIDSESKEYSYSMNANKGETLFSVLQRYDVNNDDFKMEYQEYEGMGAFLTNINDLTIDVNSQFWELSVNGEQSSVGASGYLVDEGDLVTYKVTNFN